MTFDNIFNAIAIVIALYFALPVWFYICTHVIVAAYFKTKHKEMYDFNELMKGKSNDKS
jgi:low affinity Fe/Cu permease